MSGSISCIRALLYTILFTCILGIGYPLFITGITSVLFPVQSHGSLISDSPGVFYGSEYIGMNFSGPMYFIGRPSATSGGPYNPTFSGGSNNGPTSLPFIEEIKIRTDKWRNLGVTKDIPSDLVMASGSGLDPHLSVDAALIQVPFIAKARNISPEIIESLVINQSRREQSIFSGRYVNVFLLNRNLDSLAMKN